MMTVGSTSAASIAGSSGLAPTTSTVVITAEVEGMDASATGSSGQDRHRSSSASRKVESFSISNLLVLDGSLGSRRHLSPASIVLRGWRHACLGIHRRTSVTIDGGRLPANRSPNFQQQWQRRYYLRNLDHLGSPTLNL
jgi:hypothetical protein